MKTITNRSITVQVETVVAEVSAWPDEVYVSVAAKDGMLTPQQARDLAEALIAAAEDAPHLDWTDDPDNASVTDDRDSS